MHRREMLKFLSAAAALFAAQSETKAGAQSSPWKTAVGLNGFASSSKKYEKTYPIWEVLDFASRAGFDGVELMRGWPMGNYPRTEEKRRVAALKRMYDGFGLVVFSLQAGAGGAFAANPAAREAWLEEFRANARFAKALGADCIGLWPGGRLRGQSFDEALRQLARSFREAARIASDLGLVAAVEIEPPFIFNTEKHLRRILEETNHPAFKTIYDPSHFDLMNGSTGRPHEMLERIGVENIGYVHFTDSDGTLRDGGTSKHLACGDGHIDVPRSLRTLLDGGFKGWIMIDAWQVPDPYDACTKGKQAIDRALAR